MDFKTEQDKFDQIKWFDSMKEGRDMCGTYEFCSCCKKEPTYPCARRAPLSKRVYTHCDPARARISAEGGTAARQIRNFGFFQEKGDSAAFFRGKSPFLFEKEI